MRTRSQRRGGAFQTPLYRRPPDPSRYSRAEIDDGALAGQGLELVWVDSPVDAFFLEIQGSGQVRLDKGGTTRIGYDGGNGRAYVAVGRLLIDRGIVPRERMSMAAIRDWMLAHPEDGAALRRENPSYVFFREIAGAGPIGAEQVVLTPQRSEVRLDNVWQRIARVDSATRGVVAAGDSLLRHAAADSARRAATATAVERPDIALLRLLLS